MIYRHISLLQGKVAEAYRCEPAAVGMSREVNPKTYKWDNRQREVFSLFQYTVEGEGLFRAGSREYPVRRGQAFLVNCPSDTAYRLPDAGVWEFLYVILVGDLACYHVNELITRHGHVLGMPEAPASVALLRRLYDDATASVVRDKYWLAASVYRFLMELYRELDPRDETPAGIRRAVQRIEHDYGNPLLGLEDLARDAGVSRFHFIRLFSRHTGLSPYAYLAKTRMRQAVDYLKSTDMNVKEISRLCGFNDFSYFCRVFKRQNGVSPGSSRK